MGFKFNVMIYSEVAYFLLGHPTWAYKFTQLHSSCVMGMQQKYTGYISQNWCLIVHC